jgi:membrane-associated phospholipid phosphatase
MNATIVNKNSSTSNIKNNNHMFKRFADKIDLASLRKNLPRTLMALNFTLTLSTFMTAMQAVADNRAIAAGLDRKADLPLPDFLMDWASNTIPMHMADLLLNSLIFVTIATFLISWRWRIQQYGTAEGHFRTLRIARKFLWMLGFAYLLRSVSLLSTTMPPTDPRCVYKKRSWSQIPFMGFEIMTKQGNTCSDKVFSGHSSMATLIGLFWLGALLRPDRSIEHSNNEAGSNHNKVPRWRKIAALGILIWVASVYIFCVLCRNHYSIDIIVAVLVCSGIFSTYQLCLQVIELLTNAAMTNRNNYLASKSNAISGSNASLATIAPPSASFFYNHKNTPKTILYSPIKDPEMALESPIIEMQEISQSTNALKPAPTPTPPSPTNPTKIPYAPRLFIKMLKVVAWMDGIDLKP